MRIALTDAERAEFVPGVAVQTDGVKNFTTRHMNLTRSLAHVYDIQERVIRNQIVTSIRHTWINRDTGRED